MQEASRLEGEDLSKAGKEVLIKAVAQAIPTYTMSCFKIPDSLCDDLTSMIKEFLVGLKSIREEDCPAKLGENVRTKIKWRNSRR